MRSGHLSRGGARNDHRNCRVQQIHQQPSTRTDTCREEGPGCSRPARASRMSTARRSASINTPSVAVAFDKHRPNIAKHSANAYASTDSLLPATYQQRPCERGGGSPTVWLRPIPDPHQESQTRPAQPNPGDRRRLPENSCWSSDAPPLTTPSEFRTEERARVVQPRVYLSPLPKTLPDYVLVIFIAQTQTASQYTSMRRL